MPHERYGVYDGTLLDPGFTPEQCEHVTKLVTTMVNDANDQREILMALGVLPQDFTWKYRPGQHGRLARIKITPDGQPYPDPPKSQEPTSDARPIVSRRDGPRT